MLPEYAREIRTKFISIQSGLLQDATLLRQSDFADAVQRAGNLVAIAREIISLPVQELLLWLPRDRTWMPASGPFAGVIGEMLDEGTILIEEDNMPDDGDGQWRVRLTEAAVEVLLDAVERL